MICSLKKKMNNKVAFEYFNENPIEVSQMLQKALARTSFADFVKYTKPDYEFNWHHTLLANTLNRFVTDPNFNRLIVQVAPRRGKSELVSRRLPAYFFGKFPDRNIIAASYGADLAQAMNRDVQRIIDSDRYRDIFPDTRLSGVNVKTTSKGAYIRTSDKFEIVNHTGMYRSAGVGGGITGMGADMVILDDLIKDMAEAMSPKRKQVIWDWYTSTLSTRLSKIGKVIVVATRWAEDDLSGRLLAQAKVDPKADQWEVVSLPEEFSENHEYKHPEDKRSEGDLLWPDWFPEDVISKTKASVGSRVWASLYQQEPAPKGGTIVKKSWIRRFKEIPESPNKKLVLSVDCSFKASEGSDFVVLGLWCIMGPNKYLIHLSRARMTIIDTIAELRDIHDRFKGINYTLIEDKANGSAIIDMIKDKIKGVIPFNPGQDSKIARFSAIAPQIEAGNLLVPDKYYEPNREKFPWCTDVLDIFIDELTIFPNAAHDDTVDMTSQLFLKENEGGSWFDDLIGAGDYENKSPEEIKTRELADMMGWNLS